MRVGEWVGCEDVLIGCVGMMMLRDDTPYFAFLIFEILLIYLIAS